MTSELFRYLGWLNRCAGVIRLLKAYVWAVVGPSFGIYALLHGELLGACVFTGIGLMFLSDVVDRHVLAPPKWLWKGGLISGAIGFLALAILLIRAMQEQP
jgi:hypothetical protein